MNRVRLQARCTGFGTGQVPTKTEVSAERPEPLCVERTQFGGDRPREVRHGSVLVRQPR